VGVTRRTPISWVFLIVAVVTVSGDRPKDNSRFLLPAEVAWTTSLPAVSSAPGALDEAHVYVPLQGGRILALDRETGSTRWTHTTTGPSTPLAVGGKLFVPTEMGLESLDVETGQVCWKVDIAGGPFFPLVALNDDVVAGMSASGVVAAFDTSGGVPLWQRDLGPSSTHLLAAAANSVFLTVDDGRLIALAAADGQMLWEQHVPGVPSRPVAAFGHVFVGSTDNSFFAFDDDSGSLAWRWRTGGDVVGAVVSPQHVYLAALDNRLRALDRESGNQRWQLLLPTRPAYPPQVVGNVVVVTGVAPEVRAFDTVTGMPIGSYVAPSELRGPVLVDPQPLPYEVALAVITRDGQAIGLRPTRLGLLEPPIVPLETLPGRISPFP
jgi:outer membrane protein assembly factor BamB